MNGASGRRPGRGRRIGSTGSVVLGMARMPCTPLTQAPLHACTRRKLRVAVEVLYKPNLVQEPLQPGPWPWKQGRCTYTYIYTYIICYNYHHQYYHGVGQVLLLLLTLRPRPSKGVLQSSYRQIFTRQSS